MNSETEERYWSIIAKCKSIFKQKNDDYGAAWRVLRLPSITDQILIKAQRIRFIQEKGVQKVDEPITTEFKSIINYCLMALMQMQFDAGDKGKWNPLFSELEPMYDRVAKEALEVLKNKNHDYSDAWRAMRVTSMTDIILMKLMRIKQIEDHQGKTITSEGVDANYRDMVNYSVFCLIKLNDYEHN